MKPDPEIELAIRGNAEWLDNYVDQIMSCRVVVDRPHLHHKDGNLYQIRVDVKVPGREVVVTREPGQNLEFRDPDRVIRDAFDELRRQLEDHTHRLRREVKVHEPAAHARVSQIFAAAGYGFLETPDGREIYFHRNSVLKAKFEDLHVGTEVRLVEELGDKGPQASTVIPVGRHSHL
jgi:cold shock CspA family protein